MHLLIVEDDFPIQRLVEKALLDAGYQVDTAADATEAVALAGKSIYDAFIIDLNLPDGDGLDLIAYCRSHGNVAPVLILSARRSVRERVRGLEQGGDDYLTKPFAIAELLARVRSLLRRSTSAQRAPSTLVVADLVLDLVERQARRGDRVLQLTPHEFALLEYLCRNAGKVVTRAMILNHVWHLCFDPATNVVEVHIYRLRNKVDDDGFKPLIHTVRGVGYLLKHG